MTVKLSVQSKKALKSRYIAATAGRYGVPESLELFGFSSRAERGRFIKHLNRLGYDVASTTRLKPRKRTR